MAFSFLFVLIVEMAAGDAGFPGKPDTSAGHKPVQKSHL
jgi:hypothetical protein